MNCSVRVRTAVHCCPGGGATFEWSVNPITGRKFMKIWVRPLWSEFECGFEVGRSSNGRGGVSSSSGRGPWTSVRVRVRQPPSRPWSWGSVRAQPTLKIRFECRPQINPKPATLHFTFSRSALDTFHATQAQYLVMWQLATIDLTRPTLDAALSTITLTISHSPPHCALRTSHFTLHSWHSHPQFALYNL